MPLTLRRRRNRWRCRESNPILLGASEALSRLSFIPKVMRRGGVEPPQRAALALQAGELADAQHPPERGGRPDSNRRRGDHDPECSPLHHGHSGDGRARTGGLSPDKRALWPSELRPRNSRAGGIRTHGLELMRLARTTAPLPRKVWLAGLEPAIPGFQGRWGGQLPHSQKISDEPSPGSAATLVGGRVYFLAFSLAGPVSTPYREVDQHVVDREHPRRGSNPQLPG